MQPNRVPMPPMKIPPPPCVVKGGCDNVVRSRDNPKIVIIIDNLIMKRVIFAFASQ